MSIEIFYQDEPGYSAWVAAHRATGYVVDRHHVRGQDPGHLHKADCFTIGPGATRNGAVLPRVADRYKACSDSKAQLAAWVKYAYDGTEALPCSHCNP